MKIGIILILSILILDQGSKLFVMQTIAKTNETIVALPNLLEFEFILNKNISFGIPVPPFVIYAVILVALGVFIYLFKSVNFKTAKIFSISVSLFIAGTTGNLIDRIIYGGVVDFIHHPFLGSIHRVLDFIYNFADLALNLAVVLFAIDVIFLEHKRKKHETRENI